jgi:hypothetical protein
MISTRNERAVVRLYRYSCFEELNRRAAFIRLLAISVAVLVLQSKFAYSQRSSHVLGGTDWDILSKVATGSNGVVYFTCVTGSDDLDFTRTKIGMNDVCIVNYAPRIRSTFLRTVASVGPGVVSGNLTSLSVYDQLAMRMQEPRPFVVSSDYGVTTTSAVNSRLLGIENRVNVGYDIMVTRMDSAGKSNWMTVIGGSLDDAPYAIRETRDGGLIIVGSTNSFDGDFSRKGGSVRRDKDVFVLKLDAFGDKEWVKTFGGSQDDVGTAVVATQDGGYFVAGATASDNGEFEDMNRGAEDAFVIKIDSNGNVVWKQVVGTNGPDQASCVEATSDGGCVIGGTIRSRGAVYNFFMSLFSSQPGDRDFEGKTKGFIDAFVARYDAYGNRLWNMTYGGDDADILNGLVIAEEDVFAVGGTNSDDGDLSDMHIGLMDNFVFCIDNGGKIKWNRCYGGTLSDWAESIAVMNEELVIGGNTFSNDGAFEGQKRGWCDATITILDKKGNPLIK